MYYIYICIVLLRTLNFSFLPFEQCSKVPRTFTWRVVANSAIFSLIIVQTPQCRTCLL